MYYRGVQYFVRTLYNIDLLTPFRPVCNVSASKFTATAMAAASVAGFSSRMNSSTNAIAESTNLFVDNQMLNSAAASTASHLDEDMGQRSSMYDLANIGQDKVRTAITF